MTGAYLDDRRTVFEVDIGIFIGWRPGAWLAVLLRTRHQQDI